MKKPHRFTILLTAIVAALLGHVGISPAAWAQTADEAELALETLSNGLRSDSVSHAGRYGVRPYACRSL
jgi:hypothetical protein